MPASRPKKIAFLSMTPAEAIEDRNEARLYSIRTRVVCGVEQAIEVRGLVREFKGGIHAVAGIDLDVAPGEIYGFLGPNGAGKSTTVHMLTTLLPPTAGSAKVGGHDIVAEGPAVRRTIGAALQEAALDPLLPGSRAPQAPTRAPRNPAGPSGAGLRDSSSSVSDCDWQRTERSAATRAG